jgi:hypothetical protein
MNQNINSIQQTQYEIDSWNRANSAQQIGSKNYYK